MNYADLLIVLIPEAAVTVAALMVLGLDLGLMRGRPAGVRLRMGAVIATLGCAGAASWVMAFQQPINVHDGMVVIDDLNRLVKLAVLGLTAVTAWLSVGFRFTDHPGEYFALLLLATVGMMFLASTEHMLMIFVSLELLSLSLYILTAFNKRNIRSAEAALKYFLFGGMSAAFMLFGLSLVYGLSGELNLRKIAAALGGGAMDPLLVGALVMVVIGFGFKVAAAPFHLWAPDAYQGAPIPSAAFIASGSKVASFFILAKVMIVGFRGGEGQGDFAAFETGWVPLVAVVAALSMVVGNVAALAQTSVRRLIAYSAVARAGYVLVGLAGGGGDSVGSVLYYAVTYALTTLGAFGVVGLVQETTGREDLEGFAGLGRRAPVASFCLMLFLLSLAGIPPLAGFFGKFYLFAAALKGPGGGLGLMWLVLLAVGMSAVSLYYYLKVLKQVYVSSPTDDASGPIRSPLLTALLVLLAAGVLVLGCAPNLLVGPIQAAARAAGY